MPWAIDSDGKVFGFSGPRKPPMTQELYEEKNAQLWWLHDQGMITIEDCLSSCNFLRRERDEVA